MVLEIIVIGGAIWYIAKKRKESKVRKAAVAANAQPIEGSDMYSDNAPPAPYDSNSPPAYGLPPNGARGMEDYATKTNTHVVEGGLPEYTNEDERRSEGQRSPVGEKGENEKEEYVSVREVKE